MKNKISACVVFLLITMTALSSNAETLKSVTQIAQGATADGVASQARIDKFDDETDTMTREYRAALKQLAALREYNAQLEKLIAAQKTEMVSIRQQIDDVTNVDRSIMPLMFRMIDALEQFVALDVPFLASERKARVANLQALMDRSDANPAEKYRKILEAYEIENEYGRTIEAYEGEMDINGETRTVSFLRIGRVALVYQTLDGAESGAWDKSQNRFIDLEGDFNSELRSALRIAKQQAAPDLLVVPVLVGQ
jgi:hypothetical protein